MITTIRNFLKQHISHDLRFYRICTDKVSNIRCSTCNAELIIDAENNPSVAFQPKRSGRMTDLKFDHKEENIIKALGVDQIALAKFMIDVEHCGASRITEHIEFIWASDQSFEMKIAATFVIGGVYSVKNREPEIRVGKLSDLPKSLLRKLKEDGLI